GLVAHGRGGRRGILRIERHDQDALAAARFERREPGGDRRVAVAHRPVDDDALIARRQRGGKLLGLRAGDGLERRLVLLAIPDARVIAAAPPRPDRQGDPVWHPPPTPPVL